MTLYSILADCVVCIHLAYVAFVVVGLLLILIGGLYHWRWTRKSSFRLIHLGMIAIVVVESLLNYTCPLTTLEGYLRRQAGEATHVGSFMGRLAHDLLFFDLPPSVFAVIYCSFGGLVVATFLWFPPNILTRRGNSRTLP